MHGPGRRHNLPQQHPRVDDGRRRCQPHICIIVSMWLHWIVFTYLYFIVLFILSDQKALSYFVPRHGS